MKGSPAIVSGADQPLTFNIGRYRSAGSATRRCAEDLTLYRLHGAPYVARLSTPLDGPEASAHPLYAMFMLILPTTAV